MTDKKASTKTPIKVLIVDDQRLTRLSLKTSLQEAGSQIELLGEASEGKEAIEMAGRLKPDVILMDIGMPVMDGIKATQEIKRKYESIHVVMLTSHESDEDILDAFRSGATSYCLKETANNPGLLVEIIESSASGSCWIDPRIARVVVGSLQPQTSGQTPPEEHEATAFTNLTEREIDVLKLIAEGQNNATIAENLCLSTNTVKTHLKNIFQKLGVEDRTAAALKAVKDRII